jgi:hypothetical protein
VPGVSWLSRLLRLYTARRPCRTTPVPSMRKRVAAEARFPMPIERETTFKFGAGLLSGRLPVKAGTRGMALTPWGWVVRARLATLPAANWCGRKSGRRVGNELRVS